MERPHQHANFTSKELFHGPIAKKSDTLRWRWIASKSPFPNHTVQTGNCPLCGQVKTCDVHWREDVFNPSDMDIIRNQEDMSPNHNVYPGGTPGRFHHHLVIFVDHPDFTFEGLEDLLRRRIRQHNNWDMRTLSIRFVSLCP